MSDVARRSTSKHLGSLEPIGHRVEAAIELANLVVAAGIRPSVELAYRAGLAVGTCAAMVVDLELGGLAARAAGGRYLRLR